MRWAARPNEVHSPIQILSDCKEREDSKIPLGHKKKILVDETTRRLLRLMGFMGESLVD